MSSRRPSRARKPRKVSKFKREDVARIVGDAFNKLNPDEKRNFVDRVLTSLMTMTPKHMGKLFGKFVKRGRPSAKDLEIVNSMIVAFLWSVKEEFRYHYATMIYKRLPGVPMPKDLPWKINAVKKLNFIHAGVTPEMYDRLYAEYYRMKPANFDEFFDHLLSGKGKT